MNGEPMPEKRYKLADHDAPPMDWGDHLGRRWEYVDRATGKVLVSGILGPDGSFVCDPE